MNKELEPTLMSYAKSETRNLATLVINHAVEQQFDQADTNDLFNTIPNTDGTNDIQLNTEGINKKQSELVNLIYKNIKKAEEGDFSPFQSVEDVKMEKEETKKKADGVIFSIPIGRATDNAIIGNLGPDIPIEFSAIGDVQSDVKTNVKEFGINGGVIEFFIEVKVNMEVVIPFSTGTTVVTRNIPIGMGVFRGEVPQFYNGSGNSSPSIQLN